MILRLAELTAVLAVTLAAGELLRRYFANATFPTRFDKTDVDQKAEGPLLVEFTSPHCWECKAALPVLKAASMVFETPLAIVDARTRPDLAEKYSVRSTPVILVVDAAGKVKRGWFHTPPADELQEALAAAAG